MRTVIEGCICGEGAFESIKGLILLYLQCERKLVYLLRVLAIDICIRFASVHQLPVLEFSPRAFGSGRLTSTPAASFKRWREKRGKRSSCLVHSAEISISKIAQGSANIFVFIEPLGHGSCTDLDGWKAL